jgi:FtsP/CotA-like multicopper oxidase with cupredoxin domain
VPIVSAERARLIPTCQIDPGERYDLVFDFSQVPMGSRIIMENYGADAPFGGFEFDPDDYFPDRQTDRIMAFDVVKRKRRWLPDRFDPSAINHYDGVHGQVDRVRKVALFEGKDEFGRLQPILGTAEPELNAAGQLVSGALPWHEPTTENPALNSTEIWEIYNATEDAHPVHLHLVNFEILDRQDFIADGVEQPVTQHDGAIGIGFRLENIHKTVNAVAASGVEKAPKDMVTAYPDQVTRIKATFDRPGRYVWHCHILSHEDHEMMRVLHVGPGA